MTHLESLNDIGELVAQLLEQLPAPNIEQDGDDPETGKLYRMIPEPEIPHEALPIAVNEMIQGIDFENPVNVLGHDAQIPHDGACPDADHEDDINGNGQILEERLEGADHPGEGQGKAECGNVIIR